jgi:hypothetical protein
MRDLARGSYGDTDAGDRDPKEQIMKRVALAAAVVLGLYLTGRAIAELFVIHWGNPASYRNDWGGPSLAGVLVVHCLPGLILPGYLAWRLPRNSQGYRRVRS